MHGLDAMLGPQVESEGRTDPALRFEIRSSCHRIPCRRTSRYRVIDADEAAIASGKATGVQFAPVTVENLAGAIRRAGALFNDKPVWRSIQKKGMTVDVSWRNSARRYADLYRQIVKTRTNSS